MATGSRLQPAQAGRDNAGPSRLRIYGIKEMPSGQDDELAALFRDLRRAMDASEEDVAARLQTDVETIRALEEGALLALPPFAETSRIVIAYTSILGLDARPILRRIHGQMVARVTENPAAPRERADASPPMGQRPQAAQAQPKPQPQRPQAAQPQGPVGARGQTQARPSQQRPEPDMRQGGPRPQQQPRPDRPSRLEQVRPLREPPQGRPHRMSEPQAARPAPERARPDLDPVVPPPRASAGSVHDEFVEDADMGEFEDEEPRPPRFGKARRWLRSYGLYAASGLVSLTVISLLIFSPNTLIGAFDDLPQPFPTLAETMRDLLAPGDSAPALDEDDPRSRKADRLPGPDDQPAPQ